MIIHDVDDGVTFLLIVNGHKDSSKSLCSMIALEVYCRSNKYST